MTIKLAFDEWELQKLKRLTASNVLTYSSYDASNSISHAERVEFRKWKLLDAKISSLSKPRRHVVEDALKEIGDRLRGSDMSLQFRNDLMSINNSLGVDKAYLALEHEGNFAPYEALIEKYSTRIAYDPVEGDVVPAIHEAWASVVQSINPAKAEIIFNFVDENAMNAANAALHVAAGWKDEE